MLEIQLIFLKTRKIASGSLRLSVLAALCWHTELLALVPVPLGDLVGRHIDLRGDLHLGGVRPVRVLFKVL